jgi:hypothetical protein
MVNVDELNRFVKRFGYGFQRLMIIMLCLFMAGIVHCNTPNFCHNEPCKMLGCRPSKLPDNGSL